jgi:hypothetical protein
VESGQYRAQIRASPTDQISWPCHEIPRNRPKVSGLPNPASKFPRVRPSVFTPVFPGRSQLLGCMVFYSLRIGNHFIAADHGTRSRADVVKVVLRWLEASLDACRCAAGNNWGGPANYGCDYGRHTGGGSPSGHEFDEPSPGCRDAT